jgi:signal transduction histidine kinase
VSLSEDNGCLRLSVADNGRGLPAGRTASTRRGFGLIGMRERMRAAGGLLRVHSGGSGGSGAGGVTVIAEVPLHASSTV